MEEPGFPPPQGTEQPKQKDQAGPLSPRMAALLDKLQASLKSGGSQAPVQPSPIPEETPPPHPSEPPISQREINLLQLPETPDSGEVEDLKAQVASLKEQVESLKNQLALHHKWPWEGIPETDPDQRFQVAKDELAQRLKDNPDLRGGTIHWWTLHLS